MAQTVERAKTKSGNKVLLVIKDEANEWLTKVGDSTGFSKTKICEYIIHNAMQQSAEAITAQLRKARLESEMREIEKKQQELATNSQTIRDELTRLGKR